MYISEKISPYIFLVKQFYFGIFQPECTAFASHKSALGSVFRSTIFTLIANQNSQHFLQQAPVRKEKVTGSKQINALNAELNPICYLLALLGAHHFLHVSRIRAKLLTFRLLMSYIYVAPILDVSRSHTTTQHSR